MEASTEEKHLAICLETSKISILYLKEHTPIEYQDFWGINVIPTIARCNGCNCTDALLKLQYYSLKALDDTETDAVRLYPMDFYGTWQ